MPGTRTKFIAICYTQTMTLRPFTTNDASVLSCLIIDNLRKYYAQAWDLEEYCALYAEYALIKLAESEEIFVVEDKENIVATGSLAGNQIKSIFVSLTWQSKGIGRWLITQLEQKALIKGINKLIVLSGKHAVGFYEKLGYHKTERVFSKGEDIEMEKSI